MRVTLMLLAVLALGSLSERVYAQGAGAGGKAGAVKAVGGGGGEETVELGGVKYKKKTTYDFDDDLVEGDLQRPDGELVAIKRKAKHSSLIKIREHFIPEMLKSADDI